MRPWPLTLLASVSLLPGTLAFWFMSMGKLVDARLDPIVVEGGVVSLASLTCSHSLRWPRRRMRTVYMAARLSRHGRRLPSGCASLRAPPHPSNRMSVWADRLSALLDTDCTLSLAIIGILCFILLGRMASWKASNRAWSYSTIGAATLTRSSFPRTSSALESREDSAILP